MSKADKKMGKVKPKEKPLVKEVCNRNKKKPKVDKRPWADKYYVCPFCKETLGLVDPTKGRHYFVSVPGRGYSTMVNNISTKCDKCGAFEVKDACPACHRSTWFLPDDKSTTTGVYKHKRNLGCGFEGRLKIRDEKK